MSASLRTDFTFESKNAGGVSRIWPDWLVVITTAATLYMLTASQTIGWQDSGQLALRVAKGELANPFGLALAHPLQYWICRLCSRLLPIELPVLLPMIAAIFGAAAVANVYAIVKTLVRKTFPAVLASASLAFAHTFWHMSTMAKGIDPMAAALLTCEMWTLIQWDRTRRPKWLIVMFLVNGLGVASLNMALLSLPVIGIILILAVKSGQACGRTFIRAGVCWVAGSSLFTGYVACIAWKSGDAIGTIRSALFGDYSAAIVGHQFNFHFTFTSLAFTLLSFPNLTLPAACVGITCARRVGVPKMTNVALACVLAIHLLFVLRYQVIDQYTFLLPAYSIIAIFSGIGFAFVQAQFPARRRAAVLSVATIAIVMTPVLYVFAPSTARRFHALGIQNRHKPYRDDYKYLFSAWGRGEDSADRMSRQAIDLAKPRGVICTEGGMGEFAIEYQIVHDHLTDVTLLLKTDAAGITEAVNNGGRVVFVPVPTVMPPPTPPTGQWRRVGDLYVLER